MSWLQLLAVGKSILNIENRPTRYKMARRNLLPKFGPVDELGLDFTGTPPVVVTSASMPEKNVEKPRAVRQPPACPPKVKNMKTAEVEATEEASEKTEVPVAAYPQGRWTLIKNAFIHPSTPKSEASTVKQGELKLGVIRVARNDLNDADLELVPASPQATASRAVEALPGEERETDGIAFSRITTRLFGAGRS